MLQAGPIERGGEEVGMEAESQSLLRAALDRLAWDVLAGP
jgi:hypothetical protein